MNLNHVYQGLRRLFVWLVLLSLGIMGGGILSYLLIDQRAPLGLAFFISFFVFSIALGLGLSSFYSPNCRHKKRSVFERVVNTSMLRIFVLTYEELLAFLFLGLIAGAIICQKRLFCVGYADFQVAHQYWVIAAVLGFVIGALPEMDICVLCGQHQEKSVSRWYMPILNPQNAFATKESKQRAQEFANDLWGWISSQENEGGVLILNGGHGSGKTSFKNLVLWYFWAERRDAAIIVEISPWETVGARGLQKRLLSEILAGLNSAYALGSYKNDWKGLLSAISKGAPGVAPLSWFVDSISAEAYLQEFRRLFESLRHQVVVVLEDLERLEPVEFKALLRLVDELRLFPNLHFIIPADVASCDARLRSLSGDLNNAPEFFLRALPGRTWEMQSPSADERGEILRIRHDGIAGAWRRYVEAKIKNGGLRVKIDEELLRLDSALGQIGRILDSYRKLNTFSRQILALAPQLQQDVDLPDLMLAEATRIVDPPSFYKLFDMNSAVYSSLPDAYDTFSLNLTLGLTKPEERARRRAERMETVLSSARDPEWIEFVLREVFGGAVKRDAGGVQVSGLADPSRNDGLLGRIKSPKALAEYRSQQARKNISISEIVEKTLSLPVKDSVVYFFSHVFMLRDRFRANGSEAYSEFVSDLVHGYSNLFRQHPDRLIELLTESARESIEFNSDSSYLLSEFRHFSRLIWSFLLWLPRDMRMGAIVQMVEKSSNIELLAELCSAFFSKERKIELFNMYGASEEDSKQLYDIGVEIKSICRDKAEELFLSDKMQERIFLNSLWLLDWRVYVSDDKFSAQKRNVEFIYTAMKSKGDLVLASLNRYYLNARGSTRDPFVEMFGPAADEIVGLFRKHK